MRLREARFDLLAPGTPLPAGTLPGGGTYTQAAGSGQTEETVQTSASTVARWAFVANLPRIGILADGGIGLVLEPPRTNILLRSTEFDNAQWAKLGGSNVNANATTSPTGASDADTSTAGAGYWQQGQACSVSVPYTGSVYVRGDGAVSLGLLVTDTSDGAPTTNATFVLSTSYQRLAVTLQGDATMVQAGILIGQPVNFQAGHSYAIWQGQTEQGRYATNPIITAGTTASRAGFRVSIPLSRYVRGGVFRAVLTTVPHGAATEYDGDSATIRLWTIDANTYAEVNTTTRVLTVSVNGVARVAGVPLWWLRGHRVQWSWEVGGGNLRVRYRYSTDQGATWTLPFDPFGGTVYSDSAISTASSTIDLYSDSGSSKWWGTGVVSEEAILTAPAWALQWLPTDDASVKAALRPDGHYVLSAGTTSSWTSQTATAVSVAQATGANQPTYSAAGVNGKPGFSFDGVNDIMTFSGLASAATDLLVVAALVPTSTGASQTLFDAQTGRVVVSTQDGVDASTVGYYDGGWKQTGAKAAGAQILSWDLRSGSGRVFRNGVQIGSTLGFTPQALGGTITLGTQFSAAAFMQAILGGFVLSTTPSDALRRQIEAYLSAQTGIAVS